MQTIQSRKSRIWETKQDEYTKSLAKNQVCAILHMLDIWKSVLPKFVKLLWRHHVGVPLAYEICLQQRAKKIVSDSPGLVDFGFGPVNSVLNLPDGQVNFFGKFKLQTDCNQSC